MKTSASFSIEQGILIRFGELIDEKGLDRNAVVTTIIKEWVNDNTEVKMLVCGKCSANYSSNLAQCPQCKLKEVLANKKQQLEELKIRRVKVEKWLKEGKAQQNELDIIVNEIEALELELGVADVST